MGHVSSFIILCGLLWALAGVQNGAADLGFASIGNWGFDSKNQKYVGELMRETSHENKLALIVSPGSNFIGGISGHDDPRWETLFERVYGDKAGSLKVPFFSVLGTEDWTGNYEAVVTHTHENRVDARAEEESNEKVKTAADDGLEGPQWTMPNYWYHYIRHFQTTTGSSMLSSHADKSVGFFFIDTWILSPEFPYRDVHEQAFNDLKESLQNASRVLDYIVVVGDKSLYSSGSQGTNKALVRSLLPLFEEAKIDAYISGADNDLEIIEKNGIAFINCGSGARTSGRRVGIKGSLFYTGDAGYCVHKVMADGIETRLVATNGSRDENGKIVGNTKFIYKSPVRVRPERTMMNSLTYFNKMPAVTYVHIPMIGELPSRDAFVAIVGTIGMVIGTVFFSLLMAQLAAKHMK